METNKDQVKSLKTFPVVRKSLHQPEFTEVVQVLSEGLVTYFAEVCVEIVDCPDLTQKPFDLVCSGLSGTAQIFDIGGPPYLLPLVNREKVYDCKDLCDVANINPVYAIGAGAGPWPHVGVNCEGMINFSVKDGVINQQSRIATIVPHHSLKGESKYKVEILPQTETRCALLANWFVSEGKRDKVIKVECKKRIGKDDFAASIRKALQAHYKTKPVGLGGTFLLKEGKSKQHVMPDFSKKPLNSDSDVDDWLHFFEMSAPLVNVGVLISHDPDLDLRVQHFHSFSHHGDGGHYHIDTTPDTAHYIGYFNIAESIVRIDAPITTHKIGRD